MHARYYNPYIGRFLSVDPVGGSVGSSQSWNRYVYVRNRPLNYVDPNGGLLDAVVDVVFIVYDIGVIVKENIVAGTTEGLGTNLAALGGDVVGLAVPFATGGGAAVRTGVKLANKAENLGDGARSIENVGDGQKLLPASAGPAAGCTAKTQFGRSVQDLRSTVASGEGAWQRVTAHAEQATARAFRGGTSMEEVWVNTEPASELFAMSS